MKRLISLLIGFSLIASLLVACGTTEETESESTPAEEVQEENSEASSQEVSGEVSIEPSMSEESCADEIAFVDNLKAEHSDWYEDYIALAKIMDCFGKSKNDVEEMFELEKSSYDGDDCYKIVSYDSWLGIDGRYILTFLNGKVMSVEFIIGSNAYGDNFDLLLENMEEFLGQPADVDKSGYDSDYNWTDDFHVANFHMYRYVEGNRSRGGILFTQNDNYDYSILEQSNEINN